MKLIALIFATIFSLQSVSNINQISGELEHEKQIMTDFLYGEMIVWSNPNTGTVVEAKSCREQIGGCYAHIRRVVDLVYDTSHDYGYDPHIVLAIAKHETNLNPFAVNEVTGASGLLQLMPRSPFAQGLRFIQEPQYREECRYDSHYCQREVIGQSLTLLSRSEARCGTLEGGLGLYGSGSCEGSRRFSRYVIRRANRTRELVREKMSDIMIEHTQQQ